MPELNLSDREREEIKSYLDRGQKLPARYKALLFEQPHAAELIWPGKTTEVTNVVLPFQQIEQIDEPRREGSDCADLFAWDIRTGRQTGGWTNKLIWGDNKLILSSLKNGPLRRQIEEAGGLKLIYIDPPFDVGADFSVELEVGGEALVKEPSIIEELAYRDTWGGSTSSYASMMLERLYLLHGLLAPDGSICVHCDWHANYVLRSLLNEVFGKEQFQNEIVWWYYNKMQGNVGRFAANHDVILFYSKSQSKYFKAIRETRDIVKRQQKRIWDATTQSLKQARDSEGRLVYYDETERTIDDVWRIPYLMPADRSENIGYDTQKPIELVGRLIDALCPPGGIVLDAFCGSGTTLVAAEGARVTRDGSGKRQTNFAEGRKWIGCDLGRFAIHTSRKRLIAVQRELKGAGKPYRSFEILNLGRYERQYFVGIDPTLPEEQRKALSARKEEEFLTLILQAYKADRVDQAPPFHGCKAGAFVVIGPIDAPVTRAQVDEAVEAARAMRAARVDILGFEFEMGLVPIVQEEARARGVALTLRHIPKDVFDKRAVEKDQVVFHDVAYVETKAKAHGLTVRVSLIDFGVFYSQGDIDAMTAVMKNKAAKVQVDRGQVWKVTKDKDGIVTREQLTKHWTDWIDYWAVDFNFESKCELVTITEAGGAERQVGTGAYVFENEWQSFRTRRDRSLELTSAEHDYAAKGKYKIAVKVIDIFGNDTTKVIEVTV